MQDKKITRSDLIDLIAEKTGDRKNVVAPIVEQLFDELKNALLECSSVEIRGFGSFEARFKKGRPNARNLHTGEIVAIKPHYVAAFKAGSKLKEAMKSIKVKS